MRWTAKARFSVRNMNRLHNMRLQLPRLGYDVTKQTQWQRISHRRMWTGERHTAPTHPPNAAYSRIPKSPCRNDGYIRYPASDSEGV